MEKKTVEDVRRILSVLGAEGMLDTLLCIREIEPATASEVAKMMDIHVATAVKRLSGLHEIGLVEFNIRKGKTRSAKEYALVSRSFGLDIDLDELSGGTAGGNEDIGIYLELMKNMAERFARFSGRSTEDIIAGWEERLDVPRGIFRSVGQEDVSVGDALGLISRIIELEGLEYGNMTARSVARVSLESVIGSDELREFIEAKVFGGME